MKYYKISVFSAFAGYDSQFLALKRFEKWFNKTFKGLFHIEFDLIGWCEIDPLAIKCHNALFPEYRNRHFNDIKTVPWSKLEFDILIYSSCCQDITCNGNQKGFSEGSGTRSALIWHILPAIRSCKPLCCILENVTGLLENKFSNEFRKWQEAIDNEGQTLCKGAPEYISNWTILSAFDFGVPQNRSRSFMVSIRKDTGIQCKFPTPFELTKGAESLLEKGVNDSFYFSGNDTIKFIEKIDEEHILKEMSCKTDNDKQGRCIKQIITPAILKNKHHICPTLVADVNYDHISYTRCLSTNFYPRPGVFEVWKGSKTEIKKLQPSTLQKKIINGSQNEILKSIMNLKEDEYIRLRRFTPREWFRFMGVEEEDISRLISSNVPSGHLFMKGGNLIVVDVLFHLYKSLFSEIQKWSELVSVRS